MRERWWPGILTTCTLLGCRPDPVEPATASPSPVATSPATDDRPTTDARDPSSGDTRNAPEDGPQDAAPPSLCRALCMQRNAARAVGAKLIERECTATCNDPPDPEPGCREAARQARARVEAVPMQRRAPRVWHELADPALHCGHVDATLDALAKAGAEPKPAARESALAAALATDPFFAYTCPAGPSALQSVGSTPAEQRVDALVRACPLRAVEPGAPVHRDLAPATFLATRIVAERWQALGILEGDHEILLETLLLASALERK